MKYIFSFVFDSDNLWTTAARHVETWYEHIS